MALIIQKNAKKFGIIAVVLMLFGALLFGDELLAVILPNISELQLVSYKLDQSEFEYTGEEMKPVVQEISFKNEKGKDVVKAQEEITVVAYTDNVDMGKADIEVSVKGYLGTTILEDVFVIKPAAVEELNIVQVSETGVELAWKEVSGAHGYQIYKSEDDGNNFTLLFEGIHGNVIKYEDTKTALNRVYQYKVCAYAKDEVTEETYLGTESNIVTCYTPLATPELLSAESQNYNSILIKWNAVEGAAGYQVYRSEKADGEYIMLTETTDAAVLSYKDTTCECGKEYFYNIKACQKLEAETRYGKASNTKSSKTVPNQPKISGKTSGEGTQAELSWTKADGAQGYEIYRKAGSEDYKLVQKIEKAASLSWKDTGLDKETKYTYRIRSYCVVNGATVTGSYSDTYVKKAVVVQNVAANVNTSGSQSSSKPSAENTSSGSASSGSFSEVTKYVGVPYVYGGTSTSGWDCSGFTQWVHRKYFGVSIPRVAASQGAGGKAISKSNRSAWQPGDILCYSNGSRISHVALYIGNGKIMHALNTRYDTVIQGVDYYESWDPGNYLVTVRRYH